MYTQALKQRQFYIDTFALHRFHMLDYYKVLACVVVFWLEPAEPVVCSECGCKAIIWKHVKINNKRLYSMYCPHCCNTPVSTGRATKQARTKRQAIKRWNKMNRGIVCDIRKD